MLIDIQAKMRQRGYGEGYRHWAQIFNLKEAAKTLIFLQERGLTDYNLLAERVASATKTFNDHGARRKVLDARLKEITEGCACTSPCLPPRARGLSHYRNKSGYINGPIISRDYYSNCLVILQILRFLNKIIL